MAPIATDTIAAPNSNDKVTVFVVGLGMVGIAFCEKLLESDAQDKRYFVRTCGEEQHLAYNRVGLTEYFQHRNVESLYLNDPSWYAAQEPDRFAFHVGEQVTSINPAKKTVSTSKGNTFKYDILVMATGSGAGLPPYVSIERAEKTKGIFVYRNISDLEKIMDYAEQPHITRASVVGGGLLGLEAAKAVYDIPSVPDVSILIRQAYPLNRQLDAAAGEMVLRKIEGMGCKVLTNCEPQAIRTRTDEQGCDVFTGFQLAEDEHFESDLTIFAIGIAPRDELARACGIVCNKRGGIDVDDNLETSEKGIFAIGECASWRGNTYGLIAPGVEMADILAFNLTQTQHHAPRKMNSPDLSTKLKLMGVDVASFGDYFADERYLKAAEIEEASRPPSPPQGVTILHNKPSRLRKRGLRDTKNDPIKCLTYHDPFSSTYKKYIFSRDGTQLIGGIQIGDTRDFTKLVSITKKKKKLDVPPSEFIIGAKKDGDDDGADLDDDAQICSCHNVLKGAIGACIKSGCTDLTQIKSKTKAGAGCGGCVPLVTSIYKAEMKKAGLTTNSDLCIHFKHSRPELFAAVKVKSTSDRPLKDFPSIMAAYGQDGDSIGCEICKPVIASILSSIFNEHVMNPLHNSNQETNDKFMANIQRDGTFSVVPRIAGGEIAPDGLICIGKIAKEYGLYTKITGGQRIDMFGAQKQDLPDIWEKLIAGGFESGQAYGKSLRTVKSCVGSTLCRYGVGDSVGLAIDLENRYRGVRSPHKFKGGVSGCVRECAEAQSKDFGLIATDKGWNIFVGGNGGANPRHAHLFAKDVPPTKVVRILDRFLMLYIRTADRLVRTAPWVDSYGVDRLKKVILDDELGICEELEKDMAKLIGTYVDEWRQAVTDPELRKQFRQFVNTNERRRAIEPITERGQQRPADWPKAFPPVKFDVKDLVSTKESWSWVALATVDDLQPSEHNTTSVAVRYGDDSQLAIFHVPRRGYFATQQMCPHKRAFVLEHGIVADDRDGNTYVSCPLHKRNFRLDNGDCTNDDEYKILAFEAKEDGNGQIVVLLPPGDELDALIGSAKWQVRMATARIMGGIAATKLDSPEQSKEPASTIEIIGPSAEVDEDKSVAGTDCESGESHKGCNSKLEW